MKKLISWLMVITLSGLLMSCSSGVLRSPCPDFGAHCAKSPINHWNSQA